MYFWCRKCICFQKKLKFVIYNVIFEFSWAKKGIEEDECWEKGKKGAGIPRGRRQTVEPGGPCTRVHLVSWWCPLGFCCAVLLFPCSALCNFSISLVICTQVSLFTARNYTCMYVSPCCSLYLTFSFLFYFSFSQHTFSLAPCFLLLDL